MRSSGVINSNLKFRPISKYAIEKKGMIPEDMLEMLKLVRHIIPNFPKGRFGKNTTVYQYLNKFVDDIDRRVNKGGEMWQFDRSKEKGLHFEVWKGVETWNNEGAYYFAVKDLLLYFEEAPLFGKRGDNDIKDLLIDIIASVTADKGFENIGRHNDPFYVEDMKEQYKELRKSPIKDADEIRAIEEELVYYQQPGISKVIDRLFYTKQPPLSKVKEKYKRLLGKGKAFNHVETLAVDLIGAGIKLIANKDTMSTFMEMPINEETSAGWKHIFVWDDEDERGRATIGTQNMWLGEQGDDISIGKELDLNSPKGSYRIKEPKFFKLHSRFLDYLSDLCRTIQRIGI